MISFMDNKTNAISIGTCSWKYGSWKDLVYSASENIDFLAEYANRYRTVEVDQWFWSLGASGYGLPKPQTVHEYDLATPSDFRFTIKCPNAVTIPMSSTSRRQQPATPNRWFLDSEVVCQFVNALEHLVPKIGLLMFQFEYLNKEKMPSRSLFMEILERFIRNLPQGVPYGIEIRNPRWIDGVWLDFLRQRGISPVLLQGYWMDDLSQVLDRYARHLGDTVCIRLHGDDRDGIEQESGGDWSRILRSRDDDLARTIPRVFRIARADRQVFLNVNNHYEGSAPLTIQKIEALLAGQRFQNSLQHLLDL